MTPGSKEHADCIVSYNTVRKSITISYYDCSEGQDACKIAQKLWGPEAGGRAGIAGSPRGQEMEYTDFANALRSVFGGKEWTWVKNKEDVEQQIDDCLTHEEEHGHSQC